MPLFDRRDPRAIKLMDKFLEFAGNHTLLVVALLISFFMLIFTELRRKAEWME